MNKYIYRREDNGELVTVPWEVMIGQVNGYITLEDGVEARRCAYLEPKEDRQKPHDKDDTRNTPVVSDALGFGQHQLADFERDRVANGFVGVEFRRDPSVPEFIQVHAQDRRQLDRYTKHRGMVNQSGRLGGKVMLSEEELEMARQLVSRRDGP